MIIKGPITLKWSGYTVTLKDISIDPADRSVGIMGDSVTDFDIVKITRKGKKFTIAWLEHMSNMINKNFGDDEKFTIEFEELIFNELYKLEKKSAEIAWKRYKKKGGKMSKREFMSEYT